MPAHLVGSFSTFQAQAARVEHARAALLRCLPVGRVDPAPVPVGLDLVRAELTAVVAEMDGWHRPEVAAHWERCCDATGEALGAIDTALAVAATTGELEDLLGAVGDVVEPLAAWGDAERAWLRLRAR